MALPAERFVTAFLLPQGIAPGSSSSGHPDSWEAAGPLYFSAASLRAARPAPLVTGKHSRSDTFTPRIEIHGTVVRLGPGLLPDPIDARAVPEHAV